MLTDWNNSSRVDMSLHRGTIYRFRVNYSFILNIACLAGGEATNTNLRFNYAKYYSTDASYEVRNFFQDRYWIHTLWFVGKTIFIYCLGKTTLFDSSITSWLTAIKLHLGSLSCITLIWSVAEYQLCFEENEKGILTFIQHFYKVLVEQIY